MKIILIYPPLADFMHPYLAIPSLTAFLKQNGFDAIQKDVNVEAIDYLLNANLLQKYYKDICDRFIRLDKKSSLTISEKYNYIEMARLLPSISKFDIKYVEEAKKNLRDKKTFFRPEKYSKSRDTIMRCISIILLKGNYAFAPFSTEYVSIKYLPEFLYRIYHVDDDDPFVTFYTKKIIPFLISEQPQLIGISITYYSQLLPGFILAYLIKERLPNSFIVIGGELITYLADTFTYSRKIFSIADAFIIGEGEHALLKLAEKIKKNCSNYEKIPNLVYYKNGKIIKNKIKPINDLNTLPTPCFKGLPFSLYFSPFLVLPIQTSRGCYWNRCAFCNYKVSGYQYRERKPELVVEDIIFLSKKYKTPYFFFTDFALSPYRLRTLSSLLISKKIKIKWQCLSRGDDDFNDKLCGLISKAGCLNISFGFESGSQSLLNVMDKGIQVYKLKEIIKNCKKFKINVHLHCFIGFPSETIKEAKKTLEFIFKNRKFITFVSFAGCFLLCKGSKVFNAPQRYGITKIYNKRKDDLTLAYKYDVNVGMSQKEAKMIEDLFYDEILHAYPHYFLPPGADLNAHTLLYADFYDNKIVEIIKKFRIK